MSDVITNNTNQGKNQTSVLIQDDKRDLSFFSNFDVITLRIINKFYGNGIGPINGDLNSYYIQQLHTTLSKEGLKISVEGLRKKLDFLVKIGFLEKVKTYPVIYMPRKDIEAIEKIQIIMENLKKILVV